jgi:hypothetical protein
MVLVSSVSLMKSSFGGVSTSALIIGVSFSSSLLSCPLDGLSLQILLVSLSRGLACLADVSEALAVLALEERLLPLLPAIVTFGLTLF